MRLTDILFIDTFGRRGAVALQPNSGISGGMSILHFCVTRLNLRGGPNYSRDLHYDLEVFTLDVPARFVWSVTHGLSTSSVAIDPKRPMASFAQYYRFEMKWTLLFNAR